MGERRAAARLRGVVGAAVGALAASMIVVVAPAAQGAEAQVPDGSAPEKAAASCWEIIQGHPGSPSGSYWLQTPQLIAPQQFYCDMTTDGGGWVMIGRGRDGWDWKYTGQGDPAAMAATPEGPQAFSPVALPATTVDGLLGGQRLDSLPDGIRLNRARNSTGSSWQRVDLRPQERDTWTWSFGGGVRLSQVTMDGRPWSGATTTQNWAADNTYLRLTTTDITSNNYRMGFGYGPGVAGSSAAGNYLWAGSNGGYALPFTQVFIRPRVTSPDYGRIPAEGLPAQVQRPMMANTTSGPRVPWGVTGRVGVPAGDKNEVNMEVQDIAFLGDTAYVGGMFEYVQRGANPAPDEKIRQPYLAAFDITTGEWKPQFRPQLDGRVWSLAALPNGKLVVGGDFTSAGGPNTSHLASLDPVTGEVDTSWQANANVAANGSGRVRALDVQGGWLYVGGRFNRLGGGQNLNSPLTLSNLGRVRVTDGTADGAWKPHVNAAPYSLDASPQGDRVYLAGNFSRVNFTDKARVAAVNTTDGALVPGLQNFLPSLNGNGPTTATYQQAVLEAGGGVFVGGSEHILSRYDRNDFSPSGPSNITRGGGDFQALAEKDGVVYGTCHCIHYNYVGTRSFSSPQPQATDVHSISYIGAWDAQTGEPLPEFLPQHLDGRNDSGAWTLKFDPNGCLWFGGDFVRGSRMSGGYQWLGGFGRMCGRDSTAPTTPGGLTVTDTADGTRLDWDAATDESGTVRYEILRGDRVIATSTRPGYTDTTGVRPATYWVRAVDQAGNRSATTAGQQVLAPDTTPPGRVTGLITTGITAAAATLAWQAAQDDRGVTAYDVLRDGALLAAGVTGTSHTDSTVTPGAVHSYQVVALDAAGNRGPASEPLTVTVPGGVATVATETFDGPDAPAWPEQWSPAMVRGSAQTTGGAGLLTVENSPGAAARVTLNDQARTDTDVVFSWQPDQAAAGSFLSVYLRGSGGWQNAYRPRNGYGVQLAPHSPSVLLQRNVNGATSTLATATRATGAGRQWVRFQAVGDVVRVKIWADGEAEPAEWAATATDQRVTGPGQVHVALSRSGAATTARSVTLDDITVTEHRH